MGKYTDLKRSDKLKLSKDSWSLHKDTWLRMESEYNMKRIIKSSMRKSNSIVIM